MAAAFLERCHPRTADFFRYWQSKRRSGMFPARADLDPIEMKPWLPGLVLVDVTPMPGQSPPYRLTYRLIGTGATSLRGQEGTGKRVQEAYFGNSLAEIMENYRLVIEERQIVYDGDRTLSENGAKLEAETLLLPLASDGSAIDMVVCYQEIEMVRPG
ncbi:PAS domain-containing protein [Dongia sp.]|uniref:PAS domain-containing protein n=1 Tax=Dongia sp. TaxID=1977262 RepID=UPI003751A5EA